MEGHVTSTDNTRIHYEITGTHDTALLLAHGWLGDGSWWNSQRDYFSKEYTIVQMDMGGHGESGKERTNWTAAQYADDIVAVARVIKAKEIILVGHSMSGVYVTMAASKIPNVKGIILVDTLKDLDQVTTLESAQQLLDLCRKDFKFAVENILPQYLFASKTPADVKARLQKDFLRHGSQYAAQALEPLYKIDVREFAKKITVPVRAINSDMGPTQVTNNRKYFKNFDVEYINGVGHYPMLEARDEFNQKMKEVLKVF